MKIVRLLRAFSVLLMLAGTAYAGANDWAVVGARIGDSLQTALNTYKAGNARQAMEEVTDAYFGIFEGEEANMEIAVRRSLSLKRATRLEKMFAKLRKSMHDRAPYKEVEKETLSLTAEVIKAAMELDSKGEPRGGSAP